MGSCQWEPGSGFSQKKTRGDGEGYGEGYDEGEGCISRRDTGSGGRGRIVKHKICEAEGMKMAGFGGALDVGSGGAG